MKRWTFLCAVPLAFTLASAAPVTHAGKLAPGPDDAAIAQVAARVLAQNHYSQKPINEEVSGRFFDNYLDALDPLHLYFLQSDIQEFEPLRTRVGSMITEQGDTAPAEALFTRLLERMEQQQAYVEEQLKAEKFSFDGADSYVLDRRKMPRPKDMTEAKQFWNDRLRYEYLQEKLNKQKPEEIVKTITRRYSRNLKAVQQYDADEIFQLYLNALTHVYDPHTDYFSNSSNEDFRIRMKLSLFGIGAVLQSEDGYAKIVDLTPGGPASKNHAIKPGDRIVAVAQGKAEPVDVVDMKLNKVVDLIRGPKGTEVRLTIIPADATDPSTRKTVSIIRDEVKLEEQEAKAKVVDLPTEHGTTRLGVIDLPSFYAGGGPEGGDTKSATTDVARLLKRLQKEKIQGLILDLRRNGGGSLTEAINLTGLFIKSGPVVQIKSPDGSVEVERDQDPSMLYGGPMIVLTSRFSASASEILAGALQDYGRAVIVGDSSSHGKGTVQSLLDLEDIMRRRGIVTKTKPGALKLTIRKFYRVSGASTQLKGVAADVVLPSVSDRKDLGEGSLQNPLPWDTIASSMYTKYGMTQPYIAELRKRSAARVGNDKDFAYLKDLIAQFNNTSEMNQVSLNEAQRLKTKQEADAKAKARKDELAARPASKEKDYPLTLRNVDDPMLPPAVSPNAPPKAKPAASSEGTDDEPRTPGPDITLQETERILVDLVTLGAKKTASR